LINSILIFCFTFCLLYGRLYWPLLFVIAADLCMFVFFFGRHRSTGTVASDLLALFTPLKNVNPILKLLTLLVLTIVSVVSPNIYTGLFLTVALFVIAVRFGKFSVREYTNTLMLPLSFLMFGTMAFLIDFGSEPTGVLNIGYANWWITVNPDTQLTAIVLVCKSLGAISCLVMIGMTTPMPDVISALQRIHCPQVIVDLMYLTYRYIFILLALFHDMTDAAKSRLGMNNLLARFKTAGRVYSNLFARSFKVANTSFDAMESRCYDTGISFYSEQRAVAVSHVLLSVALLAASLALCFVPFL